MKYTRTEEKPLLEVIESRKVYYLEQINRTAESVYASGNFSLIEKFEQIVLEVSRLEGIITLEEKEPEKISTTRKPKLNLEKYIKARDEGLTNEEIKEKFSMKNPRQLSGFGLQYTKLKKK